jgi:phage terminase small subunit
MASPKPPEYLSRAAKAWWRQVHDGYDLDDHHRHLLRLACESLDQSEEARAAISEHGAVVLDALAAKNQALGSIFSTKPRTDSGFFAVNSAWTLSRATDRECRGTQRTERAANAATP